MEPPVNPMPLRSFIPVAIGAVLALIAFLAISVACIEAGIAGNGDGWAGLIFSAPFTGFLLYAVARFPRRFIELRQWEQELARAPEGVGAWAGARQSGRAATSGLLAGRRRRLWKLRWVLAVLFVIALLGLTLNWQDSRWFWRVGAGVCSAAFAWALVRGWQQHRRDRP